MKKFSEMFSLNEAQLPPFLKRVKDATYAYSEDSLKGYYKDFVQSKSDYENHGSAFGGPTYGAKFKQEDVLDFLKKFPGATAKEIKIAFGGDGNWKNAYMKLDALEKKNLIKQTDQFATKGKTKFTWFAIEDFIELTKYQETNKIGKIKLTEEFDINIGTDFLKVFKEKFPTLTFNAKEANLTQDWIDNYGESLDDGNLNQFKEFLIGNDFASLKIEESEEVNESHKVGDTITFQHEFAGDSKMKHKAEIVSVNGKKLKVKVLSGDMKDKETDIESSMICEEESINEAVFDKRYIEIHIKNIKSELDSALTYFDSDINKCKGALDDVIMMVKALQVKVKMS